MNRLGYEASAVLGAMLLSVWSGRMLAQEEPRFSSVEDMREAMEACMAKPSSDFGDCTRELMFSSGADLEAAIRNARPTDIFAVDLEFEEPARLGRVRDVAIQLAIPRVLASPEVVLADGNRWELPALRLGTLYEDLDAWPGEVCRARVNAARSRAEISNSDSPEEWPIRSIHVTGSAFAVRQLLAGSFLPRARLTYGSPQGARAAENLEGVVAREVAEPIARLANAPMPSGCQSFAYQQDAEIVYGRSNPSERVIHERGDDESLFIQELSSLTPDMPLQLAVEFEDVVTLEALGTLVERYSIDGMIALLHAIDDPTRLGMIVELSAGGERVVARIRHYRCLMRAQEQPAQASPEWRASRATIFLDVASTWPLLADVDVRSVELVSRVAADEWSIMKSSFGRPIAGRQSDGASLADVCAD